MDGHEELGICVIEGIYKAFGQIQRHQFRLNHARNNQNKHAPRQMENIYQEPQLHKVIKRPGRCMSIYIGEIEDEET